MKAGSFSPDGLPGLIEGFYDAAVAPERWPTVLTELTNWFGGWGAQLLLWDKKSNTMPFSVAGGEITSDGERQYGEHFGRIDPRRELLERIPIGQLVACNHVFDNSFVDRSEFYQDFLMPLGGRYVAISHLAVHGDVATIVGLHRGTRHGGFEVADIERLSPLLRHLARASHIHQKLSGLRLAAESTAAALDQILVGVAILSSVGKVLFANEALRAMASAGDGVVLGTSGLRFGQSFAQDAVMRLIAAATDRERGGALGGGGSALVSRPSGRRPYQVTITRAPVGLNPLGFIHATVIVLVNDPERAIAPPDQALRTLYKLTPRQAELALALADGTPLVRAAERLGMSEGTARVHMTSILEKTGTTRQAELVSLLARLAPIG